MDFSYLSFDTGIDDNRVYIHRGDIFISEGVFKELDEIDKDDHLLGKPSRPVMVISDDPYNRNVVKVLPFSTRSGSDDNNAVSSGRVIRVPGINNSPNPSYIDVSQVFTLNPYQLKIKLGHASQEIVDAAVALHTLQNIHDNQSVDTLFKVFKEKYPTAYSFIHTSNTNKKVVLENTNNMYSPFEEMYADVRRVSLDELLEKKECTVIQPENKDDALVLYKEWLSMGTDLFRQKYNMSRQEYIALRDKCVQKMLGKVERFTKYSWSV